MLGPRGHQREKLIIAAGLFAANADYAMPCKRYQEALKVCYLPIITVRVRKLHPR